MINNLVIHDVNNWKDVDDTIAEIVPRNDKSDAQNAINAVDNWSGELDATEFKWALTSVKKALFQIVVS
jgi:hypothetical protein